MRRSRMVALTGAVALATTALGATTATAATHSTTTTTAATASSTAAGSGTYVVLADRGADVRAIAAALRKSGATVTSVNTDIGLISVRSGSADFLRAARGLSGVKAAANDGVVGRSPDAGPVQDRVLREHHASPGRSSGAGKAAKKGSTSVDPLDSLLWGMDMINAPEAHATELGDKRVKVGVMDTGVDGSHPDLAPNFDAELSRNFTTDMVDIDGACEFAGCVDPVDEDDNGHGTHVAGTMAASLNGIGVSGVAPDVELVNVRAGQDSGYFFLSATVNALTYSRRRRPRRRQHVLLRRPVALQLRGRCPEDSPGQAAEQDVIIETMNRALDYAHDKGVTLVGALGNNHEDISQPAHRLRPARTTRPARRTPAPSTTRRASTCRSRARTSSVSRRSARRRRRPTTPTTPTTSPPVSSRSRPPVAGSATASARRPTAPTRTSSSRRHRST